MKRAFLKKKMTFSWRKMLNELAAIDRAAGKGHSWREVNERRKEYMLGTKTPPEPKLRVTTKDNPSRPSTNGMRRENSRARSNIRLRTRR